MTLSIALLGACQPTAPHPLAGCIRTEARIGAGQRAPWWESQTRFDDRGRVVHHDRVLDLGFPLHEIFSWVYEGDRLLLESNRVSDGPEGTFDVQAHSYDDLGKRIRTETWRQHPGGSDHLGTWTWHHDPLGQPSGGTFDADGDDVADGHIDEVWEKQAFGWRVASSQVLYGQAGPTRVQELDEEERLLWSSEDWDDDGQIERVEQRSYATGPPDDQLATHEISGPAVVDVSCDYTYVDGALATLVCDDELHTGWFETTYVYGSAPARATAATMWYHDDAHSELWEHITYAWDCP